jgi:hypothetical protein
MPALCLPRVVHGRHEASEGKVAAAAAMGKRYHSAIEGTFGLEEVRVPTADAVDRGCLANTGDRPQQLMVQKNSQRNED